MKDDLSSPIDSAGSEAISPHLRVKRCHGLGNILCLLPVLDRFYSGGYRISVITQPQWLHSFSVLRPDFLWCANHDGDSIDLDRLTSKLIPVEHRTDEFGHLLGMGQPFASLRLSIPTVWSTPFENLKGCVVFAPEGGHPSRCWPAENAAQLSDHITDRKVVLVGTNTTPAIPCNIDLRGQLELHELFGLLAAASVVVTMDSAVLHIATALAVPTVALFGGVNPEYRVRSNQPVVAITAQMNCCPCNKSETCAESYQCISAIQPKDVAESIQIACRTKQRLIRPITPTSARTALAG